MIIEFKSIIKRDGADDEIIKFNSSVTIKKRENFLTWEFQDPTRGIMNLIEANEEKVNIFAGAQTIELKLKDKITNHYHQEGMPMPIVFESFLNDIQISENNLEIQYTLWQNGNIIGDYNMSLKIK